LPKFGELREVGFFDRDIIEERAKRTDAKGTKWNMGDFADGMGQELSLPHANGSDDEDDAPSTRHEGTGLYTPPFSMTHVGRAHALHVIIVFIIPIENHGSLRIPFDIPKSQKSCGLIFGEWDGCGHRQW
jgi:hypothetical protein